MPHVAMVTMVRSLRQAVHLIAHLALSVSAGRGEGRREGGTRAEHDLGATERLPGPPTAVTIVPLSAPAICPTLPANAVRWSHI